jgi:hypothetical protein
MNRVQGSVEEWRAAVGRLLLGQQLAAGCELRAGERGVAAHGPGIGRPALLRENVLGQDHCRAGKRAACREAEPRRRALCSRVRWWTYAGVSSAISPYRRRSHGMTFPTTRG